MCLEFHLRCAARFSVTKLVKVHECDSELALVAKVRTLRELACCNMHGCVLMKASSNPMKSVEFDFLLLEVAVKKN